MFDSIMSDFLFSMLFVFGFLGFVLKRFLGKNPDVKEAANSAAKNVALSLIGRIFRK